IIEDKFDNNTLPNTFLVEFFNYLREELFKDNFFRKILEDKMLYLTIAGINTNLEKLNQISELTHGELEEIRNILQQKFKSKFKLTEFIEKYKQCLINNN